LGKAHEYPIKKASKNLRFLETLFEPVMGHFASSQRFTEVNWKRRTRIRIIWFVRGAAKTMQVGKRL
jgi:hypothetical protein